MLEKKKRQLLIPVPKVGQGHQFAGLGLRDSLADTHAPELVVIGNGANHIAQLKHNKITQSAEAAAKYISTADKERSGLLGYAFIGDAGIVLLEHLRKLASKPTILTSQDHIAQAAIKLKCETFLYIVDTHSKTGISTVPLLKFLVWNLSALERIQQENPQADVTLVNPVSLTAPHQETTPLEHKQVIIALSGSGADPKVVQPLIQKLAESQDQISVATDSSSHATATITKPAKRISKSQYLSSLRSKDILHTVICFPSENVHILANEQPRKIAFLYPRGSHEVDNLIWAIKHGLSKTVIVPTELHSQVSAKLLDRGLSEDDFNLVDATDFDLSKLTISQKWTPDNTAVDITEVL